MVEFWCRFTKLVLSIAIFHGLTIGNWRSYAQQEPPVPSPVGDRSGGEAFLQQMDKSVLALAASVSDVYPSSCDDWVACDECTQHECVPLKGILTCANISHNIRCNQHFPQCPSSVRVTMERTSVAYPRDPAVGYKLDDAQMRTICGTTGLDPTFRKLFQQVPYHAEYYVGFTDGTRRSFPGREEAKKDTLECPSYDSRKRPWYSGAISYKNHLVILIDTKQEPLDASYTEKTDTLNFAKVYARNLLDTMYYQDLVNVVTFSSASEAEILEEQSVGVKFNNTDPQTHEELEPLKTKLADFPPPDDPQVMSSNLTAGLEKALALFDAAPASGMATKNIVLFTNGDIFYDARLNMTLSQVSDQLIRLFIFSMNNADDKLRILDSVAETVAGAHIRLTTPVNPLYQMRAYFSYLATLLELSRNTSIVPFWTPSYTDYYDIGEIITVVAPAFSRSEPRKLIGVAAIDVLYLEIGDILDDFKKALIDRTRTTQDLITADMFHSVQVYDDTPTDSCDSKLIKLATEKALCPDPKAGTDKKQNFLDRTCCDNCPDGNSDDRSRTIGIVLGAIGGSVLLGCVVFIVVKCFWHRSDSSAELQDKPELATLPERTSSDSLLMSPKTQELVFTNGPPKTPNQIHQFSIRLCADIPNAQR